MNPTQFQKLYGEGKKATSSCFTLICAPGTGEVGYSTSRSIGTHVKRNRQRRRAIGAFRALSIDHSRSDIIIVTRQNAVTASFEKLKSELAYLTRKLGV